MKHISDVLLVPNGGLGNQLFQISAGLFVSGDSAIKLVPKLGNARTNNQGLPIVCDFQGLDIQISQEFYPVVFKKLSNFVLITGQRIGASAVRRLLLGIFRLLFRFLLFVVMHKRISLEVGRGLGYSEVDITERNSLLIGYFQTYKYVSSPRVFLEMFNLVPNQVGPELIAYKKLANQEKPLIVHIRLGDYLAEEEFGNLSAEYFSRAIEKINASSPGAKIWVFSDDLEMAKSYFNTDLHKAIRWIPEIDESPVSTLELMRHGSAYVISNSTFSWWGAYLSYDRDARVVAPFPWFSRIPTPSKLIPPNWETIDPWVLISEGSK